MQPFTTDRPPRIKIQLYRSGPWLCGEALIPTRDGRPLKVRARANLRPILAMGRRHLLKLLQRGRAQMAATGADVTSVGFFGFIKKAVKSVVRTVKKVAKNKILKTFHKINKAIIRSPITKGLVAVATVVYPPVGVAAGAALYASNKILDAIEKGGKAAKKAKATVHKLKKLVKRGGRAGKKALRSLKVLRINQRMRKRVKRFGAKRRPNVSRRRHAPRRRRYTSRRRHARPRFRGLLNLPGGRRARFFGRHHGRYVRGYIRTNRGRVPVRGRVSRHNGRFARGAVNLFGRAVPFLSRAYRPRA